MASNSEPSETREEGEASCSDNDTHDTHPVCSAMPASVPSPISSILPPCNAEIQAGPYPERLVMGMDIEPHELIAILTLLCASQCQFVLILDSVMKGQRRIGNQSPHLRHQIRQLNFFRLIHEDDLAC
ncbi:uncharacterized protein LOC111006603 [Momordica charantia]|uniref:Uncharacterized protein LOC111006603 n=1 Tax=Momordica charantia TaxID=3673 RepID=A0A6J1BZA4_MOMCH|nr:uncharacterized protein LOC111006603 [Momordica charantia]